MDTRPRAARTRKPAATTGILAAVTASRAILVFLTACGGAAAPMRATPTADTSAGMSQYGEIDRYARDIASTRVQMGLPEQPTLGPDAQTMMVETTKCERSAAPKCKDVCTLADSI